MRAPEVIFLEIELREAQLKALRIEFSEARHFVRQAVIDETCHRFDAGEKPAAIANRLRISKDAVRATLWRTGRTTKGRAFVRKQIAAAEPTQVEP